MGMPKLRITATLSLLGLVLGVAATQWLSDRTAGRADPPPTGPRIANLHALHRNRAPIRPAATVAHARYAPAQVLATTTPTPAASITTTLVPIATPMSSLPTTRMDQHAVGNLVLHLTLDGQGQVTAATVAQSSGDSVLDTNAMDIARQWRFAVPADHPQGISGDLPMRFSGDGPSAQMP